MSQASNQAKAKKTIYITLVVTVLMFGFAFALVPLYNVFCEVTGINGKTGRISISEAEAGQIDSSRTVTVQFDGTVNSALPWEFHPKVLQMEVTPGKLYSTEFFARNLSDRAIVGQAVPSVAPGKASLYFSKTQCFCFTEQTLQPHQQEWMGVTFRVSPDLPEDVHVMTLSYTFFNKGSLTPEQQKAGEAIHGTSVTARQQPAQTTDKVSG
jgi:cytochrome c oxidase assembly protein subunit 11